MLLSKCLYRIGPPVIGLSARLMLNPDIVRHARLPKGPKILVANHPSTTDPFLMITLASDQVHILINETLFKVPVFGWYLRNSGYVPVIRGRGREAFESAKRLLQSGETVGIYPEGRVSPTEGGFARPHTGAARLALIFGVPVIPIGVHLDRNRIQHVATQVEAKEEVGLWYFRGPYALTIGEPMTFKGTVDDREHVLAVSEQIMQRIIDLSHESGRRLQVKQARPKLKLSWLRTLQMIAQSGVFNKPIPVACPVSVPYQRKK